LLETLRSNAHDDGSPRIISTSPHVAIDLAEAGSGQRASAGRLKLAAIRGASAASCRAARM